MEKRDPGSQDPNILEVCIGLPPRIQSVLLAAATKGLKVAVGYFGIDATIRKHWEIQCLSYARILYDGLCFLAGCVGRKQTQLALQVRLICLCNNGTFVKVSCYVLSYYRIFLMAG